jgi:hypothetical protein
LGVYADNKLTNLFMLNKTDGDIRGIAHISSMGNFVVTENKIYRANQSTKEFEQMTYISNADLLGLKYTDSNRIYTINKDSNQVLRISASGTNSVSAATNVLKTNVDLRDARDLAVDSEVYILFPNRLVKFTNGTQSDFQLATVSEPMQDMTRLRVGNQIYLLEPITNRVLIYSKRGELLNQVQFPELDDLNDMYVDETARELLLLNGNKVYRITF